MKIGIDANWAIYEQAGIGKYTYNLIKALLETDKKNEYILFFNFFRRQRQRMQIIKDLVQNSNAKVEVEVTVFPSSIRELLSQTSFSLKYLYKKDFDVFHSPFFSGIPKAGFPKMAVTIHDLAFMKFPEHKGEKISKYYLKRTKLATSSCKRIIAVSENTKKDLINLLDIPEKKIEVIYEGVNSEFHRYKQKDTKKRVKKYLQKHEFILSVCTLEPRKNLHRLVIAYSMLPFDLRQKYKLVLVGGSGWNNEELFKTIQDLNLTNQVIMPGFISDKDLPYFYNAAKVFVYPSLYEGFGLPVLEAMACGTPVIAGKTSSIPEIAGKEAALINPYKEEEIAYFLKKILLSEKLQKSMSEKGIKQAKKFSWEKTAIETIKVYENIFKK